MSAPWTYTADAAAIPPPSESRGVSGEEIFWVGNASLPAGQVVTERSSLRLPAMLAAVNVLATDVAVLPLNVYRRLPDGKGREHRREDLREELLNVNPDGTGEGTAVAFRAAWMLHALTYGNGYAEITRTNGGAGRPTGILLADPEAIRPDRRDGKLVYVDRKANKLIPPANILHLSGLSFDGLTGLNFVKLINEALGVGLAEQSFTADYFANGSEPGGTIEVPQTLSADAADRLRDRFEGRHRGAGNKHRVAVLEQGAKFNPSTVDPEKSQLIEARRFQMLEVLRPWRVPPHKAGDFSQSHLANIEASNLDYLTTALMFWLVSIEQQITLKLFSRAERAAGYYVEHNVNALLRGDVKTRFDAYAVALDKGWLSRDEVRARENLNPIGEECGGTKYLVQLNQTTLEKIGEDETAEPEEVDDAEESTGEEVPPGGTSEADDAAEMEGETDDAEAD